MKKTSVRELHTPTSELVRQAADGDVILIERRGEQVAELRPISAPSHLSAAKKAEIFDSMNSLWERLPQSSDGSGMIEDDRDR